MSLALMPLLGVVCAALLVLVLLLFLVILLLTVILNVWCGVPFVPTPHVVVKGMIDLAKLKPGDCAYDLGAGDARLLVAAKKREPGIHATGYELATGAFLLAKLRIWLSKKTITMRMRNFLHDDVSDADVIFLYLSPEYMTKLAPKFDRELKAGTRVISHAFTFKDREPDEVGLIQHRFSKRPTRAYVYVWKKK